MEEKLDKICKIYKNFDMYSNNTFRLHSKTKYFIKIESIEQLKEIINILKEYNSKWFVIGNGSNVILPSYYDGVIIKLEGLNNDEVSKLNSFFTKSFEENLSPFNLTINEDAKSIGFSALITLSYASGDRLIPFFANFNRILLVDISIKIFIFYVNKL